jgi:hypothetical protein
LLKRLAKNEVKSGKPSAELISGASATGANDGRSNKQAAQLALKRQFGTQRLLHPTERTSLAARRVRCKVLAHRDCGR